MPAIIDKLLRIGEGKILRELEAVSKAVNAIEDDFVKMTDDELRGMTDEFRERLANGETLDDLMPEAFATVREASKRVTGMRPCVSRCHRTCQCPKFGNEMITCRPMRRRCSSTTRVPTLVPPGGSAGSSAAQVAASHHASSRGVPTTSMP